jgi:hypothetical protein
MWLPETAVDLPTLRLLADAGIEHTVLAPWQAGDAHIETRRPYRVELGNGRSIVVALYDRHLSSAVSFDARATADADRFAQEDLEPRLASGTLPDDEPPLVVIATDGELYGHHQPFRQLFLERLVQPRPDGVARSFDITSLGEALREPDGRPFRAIRIVERTSWSCHHGVQRWSSDCQCAADGRWKAPLRAAFERLAAGIDVITEQVAASLAGSPDPWAARDAYVDVVVGATDGHAFAARWLEAGAGTTVPGHADAGRFLALMEAQRWRLAMFTSDGWYWDDPARPETGSVLRAAARAARLIDALANAGLERRLVADLRLLSSPGHRVDGAEIYERALADVGQPGLGA